MSETPTRVMNLTSPDNVETVAKDDGTFVVTFDQYDMVDGQPRRKRVRLTLTDWWLPILVNKLRDVATKRQAAAQKLLDAFKETR